MATAIIRLCLGGLAILLLAACQGAGPATSGAGAGLGPSGEGLLVAAPAPAPAIPSLPPPEDLWERLRLELRWYDIHNAQVAHARDHFLSQPRYLSVVSERAGYYLFHIVEAVEARGMPAEIALLPLVESTLNPYAVSPQRAAGLWQIMPATADYLGMPRDWWYDGRLDVRVATEVALDYLQSLHDQFDGDWLLALAAYNAGKGRVARAIARNERAGRPTDYWSLQLPRETRHYVPRLLALSAIVRYADTLGAELSPVPNAPAFVAVPTGGQIELQRAAQLAGVELRTLRALNPGHLRWASAPGQDELLLPVNRAGRFRSAVALLAPEDRVSWAHYRIEPGDSLVRIARRFDTQVALLREVNNIEGHLIRAGATLLIPRGSAWPDSLALADAAGPRKPRGYRVRPGDSLYRIASRFNVTVNDLVSWNALDPGQYLQPGQQLRLFPDGR
ncbi:LysM peptidoglycan-binding domain-containing protein [Pseudohaliea rubra]|uniref:Membrane-bound lytic murein transglycosylase D n=1 Tax=Pseudohaliea rubra DSM 19751 TaxID=1265313 RepID=A0A095WY45_9GAMM|nr:LysM peptidoglycan-binding domain-containing protein [Pseudohaliea rubra]KGE03549.1 Membrane-bound lytic murein transglycosylase D precursor [Pseudohaliea rubra DSM 19751]